MKRFLVTLFLGIHHVFTGILMLSLKFWVFSVYNQVHAPVLEILHETFKSHKFGYSELSDFK